MKTHRPWQPRMRSGSLFNPFVPPTEASFDSDHIDIPEEEETELNAAPETAAAPDPDSPEATAASSQDSQDK